MNAPRLQFQVSYSPQEDRVLLRGSFPSGQAMAVWLTRRVTLGLFDGADAISGAVARENAPAAAPADVKQALRAFEREAATAQADTRTPFDPGEPDPALGDAIKLVTRVKLNAKSEKAVRVVLTTQDKLDIAFTLPRKSFLQLWGMIEKIVADKTDWLRASNLAPPGTAVSATRH